MQQKRYGAASVLTPKGDLWILGGTHNSKPAEYTEVYEYRPQGTGRWRKSFPMPAVLRDTGLDSHCAVRLNSTHIFMAGGFANAYRVCDALGTNPESSCDTDEPTELDLGGGKVLDRAWMYDGYEWVDLAPMSTPRDRPACSLVQSDDGSVSKWRRF